MFTLAIAAAVASCGWQQAALNQAADLIERRYVIPAEAKRIALDLRRSGADRTYANSCEEPARFAADLERDLKRYDQHFNVVLPASNDPDSGGYEQWRAEAFEANAGIRDVRVLEGNIGYLRLAEFFPWDLAEPKLIRALELLKDTRGLILDLRQNGGGDVDTGANLLAALLPPETLLAWHETRRGREAMHTLKSTSLPKLPPGNPVAILVDRRSGSASEATAYFLQALGRATIIGDRTFGSAHMFGEEIALTKGLKLTIPEARPLSPQTGSNWERVGVRPDIPGGDDPLYVARRYMERRLAAAPKTDAK